jgi:SAM-dependent methyltransferase
VGAFGNVTKADGVVPNGIELQHEGAEHSRELWGSQSQVHEGPIETAPFAPASFAYVTSFETLEHVFDPVRIISHMSKLTAKDGVIAITVPSAHYFAFKFWLYRESPLSGFMFRRFPGHMTWRVLCTRTIVTNMVLLSLLQMLDKSDMKSTIAGMLRAVASVSTGIDVDVAETCCAACGAARCEFEARWAAC